MPALRALLPTGLVLLAVCAPLSAQTAPPAAVAPASLAPPPIAIVPVSNSATVTGALEITAGKAFIATSGSVTSGSENTDLTLPRRGTLRVCASTTIKLAADSSVPHPQPAQPLATAADPPPLMLGLDRGAIEASFAAGRSSDVLLTPDFRILIGGPGSVELKVRLGAHGDTCVENPGPNAPYVIVSSVFDGGAYRVQPGQRVMFQHGSLHEVVDNEKEPCGCPPVARPGTNDFPLAESAGLSPTAPPVLAAPAPAAAPDSKAAKPDAINAPLAYNAPKPEPVQPPAGPQYTSDPKVAQPSTTTSSTARLPQKSHSGLLRKIGRFFRKVFGAE